MLTPSRSASFRRLWSSSLAAAGAQGMERTTTAWLALETGGAFAIGLVFAARSLPALLLGLTAGTVADRVDRTHQLLAVAGGALLLAGSFGLFVGQGGFQVWPVVAFAFASGCLQVFDTPARQALVLDLVPRESAPRALALIALGGRFAAALGAFGAGLLIPLVGVGGCYLVVGGTYAVGAILLATLRVMQAHRGRVIPPFGQALRSAAQLILDVPLVRTLLAAAMTCEMLAFSYAIALPVFAQAVLQAGPEGLGTLNAAAAIGGALAVTLLSLLPLRVPREPVLTTVFLGFGLAMLVLAATRDLLVAAAVVVVIGCCGAAVDVLLQMLIQLAVPEEQRGRAVGVWVLGIGFGPLGDLEMGLVVGAVGAPIGLLLNGALTVAAATTLLVRAKGFRWTSLK